MSVELPVVKPGMRIGVINLETGDVNLDDSTLISYQCQLSGDCCTQLSIPVTDFDIERIERNGYELDQIVGSLSPMIRFSEKMDGTGERNYWIKRKPYVNTCTFLKENKCSIHEFKPFGCRIFPFQLRDLDGDHIEVVIHASNLCGAVEVANTQESNNSQLLSSLIDVIRKENKYREQYFETYGNN